MDTSILYLLYIIGALLSWIVFYYVVKAAVKKGIKEMLNENAASTYIKQSKPERLANPEQVKLQQRYDKGEITFEVYHAEWDNLNR